MNRAWLGPVSWVFVCGQAFAQNAAVTVTVDAAANPHPINPQIYGVAFATTPQLSDLNCPLNRSGGNAETRYNWNLNASNHASDWYFESIGEASATPGEAGDTFIANSKAASAQPMITIPMIGWVAKLGGGRAKLASFSITKYGPQQDSDWQWFPDAGNGVLANGQNVTNDPNDANMPADSSFQLGWVQHLVAKWGTAASGGLRYYVLDNEHSIWQGTHRDVHPVGPHMEEIRDKMLQYSSMIKGVDPGAKVVGPEEWGWSGYLLSGYDQQWGAEHGWSNLPDQTSHGGVDYLPWLLDQLRQLEGTQRALDVFTVHYYPQGGEYGDDVSSAMQLRRNRSTRSLWDPAYVDETWIADTVRLVPRLRSWANTYYHSDTPIGITEYNWGAEGHINGATAQADILGIFGREGLDMATRWTTPLATTPTYLSMKMYRNYDGAKSTFGDTSVSVTGGNPDQLSTFAALRSSDGALTVMVINKVLSGNTPVTINLGNFVPQSTAKAWQLTSTNSIQSLGVIGLTAGHLSTTVPPQSITLFVFANSSATPTPTARPTATFTATATATTRPTATSTATATSRARPTTTSTATATATTRATSTAPATPTPTSTSNARPTATARVTPSPGPPFGSFDTPANGALAIQGAIAVTGWALDDTGVVRVEIWRDPVTGDGSASANGKIFVGNATFIVGARPDVQALYPNYPNANRAGWGYMLLTNLLPHVTKRTPAGGVGTFTLYAYAYDTQNNVALLGSRTFTCNNDNADRPFGTIDTPAQGATVSGIVNSFGWALTPGTATIPVDGSTIQVFIDGALRGTAQYGLPRDDIKALFPGYTNTNGAIGFFQIDTAQLSNGLHTLSWVVGDDQNRTEGIGSRYFTVQN